MSIEHLPPELVHHLVTHYIHDLEDFASLSSTNRALRATLAVTTPRTILHLAAACSRTFFRPSPQLLVAATARSLAEWGRRSAVNTATVRAGLRGGIDGLFELCLEHSTGLSMTDIQRLHAMRFTIINPVVDLIDKAAGLQFWETPEYWNARAETPPSTLEVDPSEAFFNIVIYSELFAADFEVALRPGVECATLGLGVRLEYIKYCIPDSFLFFDVEKLGSTGIDDERLLVESTGPYDGSNEGLHPNIRETQLVLKSSRWEGAWQEVRSVIGDDFDIQWKQDLWQTAVYCQGLESMGMIAQPNGEVVDTWRQQLIMLRARIEGLQQDQVMVRVGRAMTYTWPYLYGDLEVIARMYS